MIVKDERLVEVPVQKTSHNFKWATFFTTKRRLDSGQNQNRGQKNVGVQLKWLVLVDSVEEFSFVNSK